MRSRSRSGSGAKPTLRRSSSGATIKVPLDYRVPGGERIDLAISRIKSTAPDKRHGVLFSNPGGPGGQGLYMPLGMQDRLPESAQQKYDLIGFDPRGVGKSSPVSCDLEPEEENPLRPYKEETFDKDVTTPDGRPATPPGGALARERERDSAAADHSQHQAVRLYTAWQRLSETGRWRADPVTSAGPRVAAGWQVSHLCGCQEVWGRARCRVGRADQRSPAKRSFSGTAAPVASLTRR